MMFDHVAYVMVDQKLGALELDADEAFLRQAVLIDSACMKMAQ